MNYIGKFISNFKELYNEINTATLTGAIDVIVAKQEDGTYITSPFHVRFGKIGVLKSKEKIVDIEINGRPVDIHMKLGESGEAFFVEPMAEGEDLSSAELATSPLPQPTAQRPAFDALPVDGRQLDSSEAFTLDSVTDPPAPAGQAGGEGTPGADTGPGAPPATAAVTFKARKVEKLVKLDGSTMFVPIQNREKVCAWTQTEPAVEPEPDNHSSSSSSGSLLETRPATTDSAAGNNNGGKQKRKQKKRKTAKHRRSLSDSKELRGEDGIFQMEDVQPEVRASRASLDERNVCLSASDMPRDCHPFSDTDLSPVGSPRSSRTPTPIKSDTEFEIERERLVSDEGSQTDTTVWQWGELPSPSRSSVPPPADSTDSANAPPATSSAAEQRSVLSGMFNFMRRTKKARHDPLSEGIYLDDLNLESLDPEVAALYFPKSQAIQLSTGDKDSGAADSGGDHEEDEGNGSSIPHSPSPSSPHSAASLELGDVAMSLCGGLEACQGGDIPESLFLQCLVTYDDLSGDPRLLERPELVVRVAGRYYNWPTAAPMLCSGLMFGRPLPERSVARLAEQLMPKKKPAKKGAAGRTYSWWSWRRISESEPPEGDGSAVARGDGEVGVETQTAETQTGTPPGSPGRRWNTSVCSDTLRHSESDDTVEEELLGSVRQRFKKTLRLSSEQIERLGLHEGQNEALFSVTTAYQGTSKCKCNIFLWNYDDKIVVSDIDGTITKSDVLGHILPIVGQNWAQSGVAALFTKIQANGYKFLYLSARSIGHAPITRDYLRSVRQGDLRLPEGPLLLSPSSLISALHREVIEKRPEDFKIPCLRDICGLFPGRNPLYAGYGNRVNDAFSYRAVGIPNSRIFTINHRGELRHELTQTFQSSYVNLTNIVDHFFPPVREQENEVANLEYNSFVYWRDPLPEITELLQL